MVSFGAIESRNELIIPNCTGTKERLLSDNAHLQCLLSCIALLLKAKLKL